MTKPLLVLPLFVAFLGGCANTTTKTAATQPDETPYEDAVGVPFLGMVPVSRLNADTKPATPVVVVGDANRFNVKPVYFELDEAALTADDMVQVVRLESWMKANPNSEVKVEGFTDSSGTVAHNKVLGAKRAQNFKNSLAARGISSDRIHTVNRGGEPRERAVVVTVLAE